jgi:GAF domain-containing protein/HAMP domain-containing protein
MTVQTSRTESPRGPLRRRLIIGSGLAALFILLAGVLFAWQLISLRIAIRDLDEQNERLALTLETVQQATDLVVVIQDRMAEPDSAASIDEAGASIRALVTMEENLRNQQLQLPEGDMVRTRIEGATESLQMMISVAEETLHYVEDANRSEAEDRAGLLLVRHGEAEQQLQQLVAITRENQRGARARADSVMVRMIWGISALLILALAVSAAVVLATVRTIALGMEQLSHSAQRLAEGHFGERIRTTRQDELGLLADSFNTMARELQNLYSRLEREVAERTSALARRSSQLEAAALVARSAAGIQDVERLMEETVHLISDHFGFYHAGLFLLDDAREYAVLRAASSQGGRRMLARRHKLKIGEVGIVGHVAGSGEPRIALDVGADAVFFDNPDLPNTHSEMGLPLQVRGHVIGVLDVQSEQRGAFSDEDVAILQTMADQVAIAIENARLLEERQQTLLELQAAYGQQVRDTWRERTTQQPTAYRYSGIRGVELLSPSASMEMDTLPLNRRPMILEEGGDRLLIAPIHLRGQFLGSIVFRQDPEDPAWSSEEVTLVEEICTQIGLALENARLMEETQERAEQERIIANITAQVRASMDPETILQTAVRELGAALGSDRAFVRLGVDGQNNGERE